MGFKSVTFCPVWPSKLINDPEKQEGTFSRPLQALWIILWPPVNSKLCASFHKLVNLNSSYSPEALNLGQNQQIFALYELEIWWISFAHHFIAIDDFKLELQPGNTLFRSKLADLFLPMWPWQMTSKKKGHLLCATASFKHQFAAIWKFELELQSKKRPIWGKQCFDLPDLDLWLSHGHHFC